MDEQRPTESSGGLPNASDSDVPGSEVCESTSYEFDPLCIGKEAPSLTAPKQAVVAKPSLPAHSAPRSNATAFEASESSNDTWPRVGSTQDSEDSFDNIPALLDVEACTSSDSDGGGEEPPALVRDTDSESGSDLGAEMDADNESDMDSLPELQSDTDSAEEEPVQGRVQPAPVRGNSCSCCNSLEAMQGVEEEPRRHNTQSAAELEVDNESPVDERGGSSHEQTFTGRGLLGFNAEASTLRTRNGVTENQDGADSDGVPDLLEADDHSDSDASTGFDVETALRDTAAAFLGLLPTVFQRGAVSASAPGGGREARRRERRNRMSRGPQPADDEGGSAQRRRVFPLRRGIRRLREGAPNSSGSLGALPVFRFPVAPVPPVTRTQRPVSDMGEGHEQGSGWESDDESVPSLLSCDDEDEDEFEDEDIDDDEDEDDEDDEDVPPLLGDDSDDDDAWVGYDDMPELLAETMSSMDSDDESDEEDGEHTPPPRRARILRPGGLPTLPGGLPINGPLGLGLDLQLGVQINNIGIEFVRNRLFAFGSGDFVPDEHLEQVLAMLGSASNPHWPPPASKDAIAALERVVMPDEPGDQSCSVCRSALEAQVAVLRMPCSHLFHPDCLNSWLDVRNSCPLCRFQLPTDD